jgi:HAD superfamily hydrolase (TIGR01509 family)
VTPVLRATVFDLDDTLIDSGAAWSRVCAAFAARHGHRWRAEDDAALHGNGGWAPYVADLCGGAVSGGDVVESCTAAMVDECAAGRVRALPGAVELVLEAGRHGPVGVATASPRRFVLAVLRGLGLTPGLSAVVCGEDVVRVKPAPDPYLRAAAEVGVPPSRCLAVEDSPNGIRSAAAAGMTVLALPRGGMRLPADVRHLPAAQAGTAADAVPLLRGLLAPDPRKDRPGARRERSQSLS